MSSKEALDLDGSKRKGRAQKVGSVWERRMMVKTAEKNAAKICSSSSRSSSSSMSNAEIEVDKKVETKQSPSGASGKIKKSPLQIKRARSASTTSSVKDEISSIKLRKLKSDSANVAVNGSKTELPLLQLVEGEVLVDSEKDLDKKAITDNSEKILNLNDADHFEEEEEVEKEIEAEAEAEIKDIITTPQEEKPKKLVIEEKVTPAARFHPSPNDYHGTSSRLQSVADLIMWRDVSRTSFVFGFGSFAIISSSYTKDINISCISVISYLGLVYLAVSFIFSRRNGDKDCTEKEYVIGEEEAVWLMKLVLPYVNEFLFKLRSLFSGDPATTMKLAVLLFILARCGGSITIWKMTKLGFFGVFMVPKLWSSYSSHVAAYGIFWIERFGDAWESCSHKKAVAFGIFSLVWNLCSVVARIWAVFVLFVAYRYYQNCQIKDE